MIFANGVLHSDAMREMWVEVAVRGVVIDPVTGEPAGLVEDSDETAIIAIPADPSGAASIISELEGIHRDAPHELLYRFFVRHDVAARRIELSHTRSGDIAARLCYEYDHHDYDMDLRPIDGLLIAAEAHIPIFAARPLIECQSRKRSAPRVLDGKDLLILSRTRRSDAHT